MRPLIAIRPQPGCDATRAAARERGLDAHCFPLFKVRAVTWEPPDSDGIDALLIGSANALRHGGPGLSAFAEKPVYAVGEKTAQAARDAGFKVVITGDGHLQSVLEKLDPSHRRLLRPSGKQRIELKPPEGVTVVERVVYASSPVPMPADLLAMLQKPAVVLLHSREAARHFVDSCDLHGVERSHIALAAIGSRVAKAAGEGWAALNVADEPSEDALLTLAMEMCQEPHPITRKQSITRKGPMQDPNATQASQALPPEKRKRGAQLAVASLAFALGAAIVGYLLWSGYLEEIRRPPVPETTAAKQATEPVEKAVGQPSELTDTLPAVASVEARLAMLEDRLSRLNLQASVASGYAVRAESLLIAFAARRMIDRGEPLRYLSDQLRLRFSNAQPRAVNTIITFAANPVTIDELSARLDALAPQLTGESRRGSYWEQTLDEISSLFTVRTEPSALMGARARLERARMMLSAGKVGAAIRLVERLPGAGAAERWIADARRYSAAQRALDLIETSAVLEPRRLREAEVAPIDHNNSPPAQAPRDETEAASRR